MRKHGKVIYIAYDVSKDLEKIGARYISRKFLENKTRVSYNKSIRFLIDMIKMAEKVKLKKRFDKDKDEK